MKKMIMAALLLATLSVQAQKKPINPDTTTAVHDTVLVGYRYVVIMDSVSYFNLVQFIGSIPANVNKAAGYILSLVDGTTQNANLQSYREPILALRPKEKKPKN